MARRRRKAHIPKFGKFAKIIKKDIQTVAEKALHDFALEMRGELVNGILLQKFSSFHTIPLSERYLKRKLSKGLDLRVMIRTGHYVDQIQVIEHSKVSYEVNVPEDAYAVDEDSKPTELRLRALGEIQEFGSAAAQVPARPHWRVIIRRAKKKAPRVAQDIASKAARLIRRDFRRA